MAIKTMGVGYRTVIGALLATVMLGWLTFRGTMQLGRSLPPLVVAWMLVLLAADYRAAAQEHAARVMREDGE